MKYFLVNGERLNEEQFLALSENKPTTEPPAPTIPEGLPKPTLPEIKDDTFKEGWTEEKRLDGVERVKTGKKRKKAYNFIGNKELSKIDYVKYLKDPPPLSHWDYSYLMSHVKTWTPKKVYWDVNREVLTQIAYYLKLYDDKNCYGAPKEWLYNRLVDLSRKPHAHKKHR